MKSYYIASCLFTARFPEVSLAIQHYIEKRHNIQIVRCCIPNFRIKPNEERIPAGDAREAWKKLPVSAGLEPGDVVYSLCHNCTNIVEEQNEGVRALSLWELIDQDETFVYPDYAGLRATIQDCWRSRERTGEQEAVRSILKKCTSTMWKYPTTATRRISAAARCTASSPQKTRAMRPGIMWNRRPASFSPIQRRNRLPSCAIIAVSIIRMPSCAIAITALKVCCRAASTAGIWPT